jgi:hypothetical protein
MSTYDLSAWPLFRSVIGETREGAPKARRCFLIAPDDANNADVRRHSETLFKYVVRPALLDTDYALRRMEGEQHGAGTQQTAVDAILDDDLIIAVLSFRNPDVFYQVALAQAAARPLILMIEEGQAFPFDPRGAKVVSYSLDTDSVLSAVNVKKLQHAIHEINQSEAAIRQTFRPGAPALAGGGAGGATVLERSRQFTYDQRLNMMREARSRIDIMGLANLAIAMHPDTIEVVRARSGQNFEIRVLQCAPTNPGLGSMIGQRDMQALNTIRNEIEAAAEAWKRISEMADIDVGITVRRTQHVVPLASALITDRSVVATPYLISKETAESPSFHALAGSTHHKVMQQEFDDAWSEAATLFRAESRSSLRAPANVNSARPGDLLRSHSTQDTFAQPQASAGGMAAPNMQGRSFATFRGGQGS